VIIIIDFALNLLKILNIFGVELTYHNLSFV